jgi:four helix bundle protein
MQSQTVVEGNGRTGNDRLQHFRIARGSALEVDAAAGLMERRNLMKPMERALAHQLVCRIVAMLTKMIRP